MDNQQYFAQQQAFLLQQQALAQQQAAGMHAHHPGMMMPGCIPQQQQNQMALQQHMSQYVYPMQGIDYPGMNDVMCGRGGGTNNHIGNIRFRQLVNEHKLRYLAASKVDKPKVAMDVVQIWRRLDPPGRFLTKTDATQGDDSLWHDVGDKKAREKASQCLRERTPDVMPFVKKLKEQEEKKKEEERKKKENAKKNAAANSKEKTSKKPEQATSSPTPTSKKTPDSALSSEKSNDNADAKSINSKPAKKSRTTSSSTKTTKQEKDNDVAVVAQKIPTAAALMENVFDDDDDNNGGNDGLTFEAYQSQMQEFLNTAPSGSPDEDVYSLTDRSLLMDAMSTNSKDWVKSFQSVGSGMMMSVMSNSLREDVLSEIPEPAGGVVPTSPNPAAAAWSGAGSSRSQRMKMAGHSSNVSMLSDLTDMSSLRNKSTRSGKMQASKLPSNFSIMSELTDLSEGLKDMGLEKGKKVTE